MALKITPINTTELKVTPLTEPEERGRITETGAAATRGLLNVAGGFVGTAETYGKLLKTQIGKGLAPLPAFLLNRYEKYTGLNFVREQQKVKANIQSAQAKFPKTREGAEGWAINVIGEAVPYMGAALAAGYFVGLPGAAMVGFAVEGDTAYDEAIRTGATERQAQAERVLVGSVNAAIEALQVDKLLKFSQTGKHSVREFVRLVRRKAYKLAGKKAKKLSGQLLKTAIQEGMQEFTQEGVSIAVPAAMRGEYPKNPDGSPNVYAIGERLGAAALGGFVAGGVLGGGMQIGQATGGFAAPTTQEIQSTIKRIDDSKLSVNEKNVLKRELETLSEEPLPEGTVVEPDALINKLGEGIEELEVVRPKEKKAITKEKGKRFAEYENILKDVENPRAADMIARQALAGNLKMEIQSDILKNQFNENEINELWNRVRTSTILSGKKLSSFDGLNKLFFKNQIPARHEIEAMGDVFGKDIVGKLMEKRKSAGKAGWDKIIAGINLPRAILASYDLSAPGRQGFLLMPIVPKQWLKSVGQGYRAFASPQYADYVDMQIRTDPYFKSSTKAGLQLTKRGSMWSGEEVFMSDFAERIPGIPASERAYVTTLNSLRFHAYKHFAQQWEGTGKSAQDYKTLASFINHATGRGDVKALKKFYPVLNAVFFAPRLQIGRVQAIGDLFTSTSPVRKIVAKDLVKFFGGGALILWLLSMMKGVEVEKDPRSSDFGKIRVGNTRIDYWAGYQQIARYTAQLIMGEMKTTETKRKLPVDRGDVIWRFIQSKLSPPAGMTVDLLRGETFLGEKLKPEPGFIGEQVMQRFTPLFIQDVIDAARYQGMEGVSLVAPLALHGIGAVTYPITPSAESARIKDVHAMETFGQKWDDLGPEPQKALRENVPQIALAEAQAKIDRENFDFLAKMVEQQQAAGDKVFKSLPQDVQDEMNELTVPMGGLARNISSNWYLNDKRYEQYQTDVGKILKPVLSKIIKKQLWKTLPDNIKRKIIIEIIDNAKKAVRDKIIKQATMKDIEELPR
jgi:hypothetical protein